MLDSVKCSLSYLQVSPKILALCSVVIEGIERIFEARRIMVEA